MKYPTYIATFLFLAIGASWAAPPTKSHHSVVLANKAKERQEQKKMEKQNPTQRYTTVALDVGKGKLRLNEKRNRNQFQGYHHRNKGH